ncbi:hypothetical protein RR46_10928 [Papilio xuthus]|uniref:Uncharacterized protein n=1 Tax=Papilio xuthus TaxID=66420 RepID=A0A194PWW0_PAPXU|nr:hypothetical protein RR46_10928 [Papilio xuthus]
MLANVRGTSVTKHHERLYLTIQLVLATLRFTCNFLHRWNDSYRWTRVEDVREEQEELHVTRRILCMILEWYTGRAEPRKKKVTIEMTEDEDSHLMVDDVREHVRVDLAGSTYACKCLHLCRAQRASSTAAQRPAISCKMIAPESSSGSCASPPGVAQTPRVCSRADKNVPTPPTPLQSRH